MLLFRLTVVTVINVEQRTLILRCVRGCSIVGPIVRHNLRLKAGVGEDDAASWIGDFFCAWCVSHTLSLLLHRLPGSLNG